MSNFQYCSKCGIRYDLSANFCTKDGTNLKSLSSASTNSNQNNTISEKQLFKPFIVGQPNEGDDDDTIAADNYQHVPLNIQKLDFEIRGLEYLQAKETIGGVMKEGELLGPGTIEKRTVNISPDLNTQILNAFKQEASALKTDQKVKSFEIKE